MADNYLEKQYADYEARKAAWERTRKYGKSKPTAKKSKIKNHIDDQKGKQEEGVNGLQRSEYLSLFVVATSEWNLYLSLLQFV